jgi:hypothetical protein
MHRADLTAGIATLLNVPLAGVGVFLFVSGPSVMSAVAFLLLAIAPLSTLGFTWSYRRAVNRDRPLPPRFLGALAATWNSAILLGMVVPVALHNPNRRGMFVAIVGMIAMLNLLISLFPRFFLGRTRTHPRWTAAT